MSRMERYYKTNKTLEKRSTRNKDLYKTIYDISEYSNIEGIATIDKNNEVDITKVKNMIKNREEYHRQKDYRKSEISIQSQSTYDNDIFNNDEKNYDIRDILNKAKSNRPKEDYHNLNYDISKFKEKKEKKRIEDPELEQLVDAISNTSKLNKLSDIDLGLDILSDLRSNNNTIVESKDSIKSILEEVKKNEEKYTTKTGIDNSFFTSSMKLSADDFDQGAEPVKKNHILKKVFIFIILLIITMAIVFLVYNIIK